MRVRPYRERDLPELSAIWNEAQRRSYEFIPYTEERLYEEELEDASPILVAIDERGGTAGLALLRREWYGEEVQVLARPGPRRQEIEGQLLSAIERKAQAEELTAVVDAEDEQRLEFFTAHGYELEGSLYQMLIELDRSWPEPEAPPSYRLRSLRPDEEGALIQVVDAAYEGERLRPGVLGRWRREAPPFGPEWVQVAEHEGRLVAAVVARPDREFNEHFRANRGYLGPAATLPEHRGRELNKALTVRAFRLLHERGFERASLYTWSGNAAALKVLRGLGFRVSHEWKVLSKDRDRASGAL